MARDWRWAPASFRGVSFYVDTEELKQARSKVIHEYPGSEQWDVEDLGAKAGRYSVTAYFVSETADTDAAAFIAALNQPTPAALILPFFGVFTCSAEDWTPSWQKDALNRASIPVTFIDEGSPANAPLPLGLGAKLIANALFDASTTLGEAVTTLFTDVGAMSAQRMAAAAALTDTASFVETVRAGVVLPDKVSATAAAAVVTLAQTAEAAAESGPGPFVAAALAVLDTIALAATPDQAAPVLQVAAATAVSLVPAVDDAPETTQAAAAIRAALAVAATMQAIRLLSTATYTDRPSAIAARTLIGTIAEAVLPLYGALGPKVTNAFSDLWGQAVTYLTQVITNLKPVVLYEVNLSLPSTVLAYRLYGDPSRATELVARNRVGTPMLMPTLFEALAPN